MRYFPKEKIVLTLVVSSLILFVFMFLVTPNTITNVSAVEANVGVYWDSNCADEVDEIKWGNLTPGSSRSIIVYIRNEIAEPIYLRLSTQDWTPDGASDYMTLRWDYTGQRINPYDDILQITLTLSVSRYIEGISSFSFDIVMTGSPNLLGDVDDNGVVNVMDLLLLRKAISLGKTAAEQPFCDVDFNNVLNVMDMLKLKMILLTVG